MNAGSLEQSLEKNGPISAHNRIGYVADFIISMILQKTTLVDSQGDTNILIQNDTPSYQRLWPNLGPLHLYNHDIAYMITL